jgi:hypothetical protein
MKPSYIVGLDLGQAQDFSALAVAEQTTGAGSVRYDIRHLERWPLGTSYTTVVKHVAALLAMPPLPGSILAVDGTGCGRAIVDMLRQHAGIQKAGVTVRPTLITAGQAVTVDGYGYLHVAKVQLVSVMHRLFGERRIQFAEALDLAETAEKELRTFKAKVTPAGSEQFLADWRDGEHDDLVLAVALACWWGERSQPMGRIDVSPPPRRPLVPRYESAARRRGTFGL